MSNGMTVFRRGNSLPHCLQEIALTSSDKKHTFSGWLLWWIFGAIKGGGRPTRLLPHAKMLLIPIKLFLSAG